MELAWLQKCTPDYLKLSEVSTIRTFSSRKWQGFAFSSALCRVRGRGGRIFVNVIPPVCILIELGQTWREGQQTIILFEHNVDCDASASGELLLKQE